MQKYLKNLLRFSVPGLAAQLLWNDILKAIKGKHIVVLGLAATGKTALVKFLGNGVLPPADYKPTAVGAPPIKVKKPLKMKDFNLFLKDIPDIGGGDPRHLSTKIKLIESADIILYLFKVDEWKKNPVGTETKILSDLTAISESVNERLLKNSSTRVLIIGTHIDQDSEFDDNDRQKYENLIVDDPFIKGMQIKLGGVLHCGIIFGSPKDGLAEDLVVQLLHTLSKN